MDSFKICFPLNLGNFNSFIPKNANGEDPNLNLIEQKQKVSYDKVITGKNHLYIKGQLCELLNSENSHNNSINNNSEIYKKIINEDIIKEINPIYNFYKSTENYLKETNNIYKYYINSRNYIHKNNILKHNIQFPNISLKESDNCRNIKDFNSTANENYGINNSNSNLNNDLNQSFNNTVNELNSK
jgi:hypothetical protein